MDIYPSGRLKKIILTIWNVHYCGGYGVYVRIIQGSKRCRTITIPSFKAGAELMWEGDQIKGCSKIDFNVNANKIHYKIKSKNKNKFCPEYLQIWFNNTHFRSDKMSFWINKFGRSISKNIALYAARKVPIQVYKEIIYGKFYRFLVDSYLVYLEVTLLISPLKNMILAIHIIKYELFCRNTEGSSYKQQR